MCLKVATNKTEKFQTKVYYKVFSILDNKLRPCFRFFTPRTTYIPGKNEAILNGMPEEEGFHCFYREEDAEKFKEVSGPCCWRVVLPVYCDSEDFLRSGYTENTGVVDGLACATFKNITIKQEDYEKHILPTVSS